MKNGSLVLNIFLILAISSTANAVPITSDLSLTATADLDLSIPPLNAIQNATITMTSGGINDIRSVNGVTVSGGSTPLNGALTDLNDGFSFVSSSSGTSSASHIAEALLFADLGVEIENTSATTTYQLNFRVDYHLTADTIGVDATTLASATIFDLNSPSSFILDESVSSDTLVTPGLFTTGLVTHFFDVLVDPLSVSTLAGSFGVDGIAFELGDHFEVSNNLQIVLTEVTEVSQNIPEPSLLLLFLIGFFSFAYKHRYILNLA